jgi:hypothetical protein
VSSVIHGIVSDYNRTGYPGTFRVEREGGSRFVVIGDYARNAGGSIQKLTPILDTRIEFSTGKRTVDDAINELVAKLSTQTGIRVVRSDTPVSLLEQPDFSTTTTNDTARNWLLRLFAATGRSLIYDLLYDPNDSCYWITIYPATRTIRGPHGESGLEPIDGRPKGQ